MPTGIYDFKKRKGMFRKGSKLSEATRQKIKTATTGKSNPFYGKKHSP